LSTKDKNYQILLVCSGNTCRSPIAEGLLKRKLPAHLQTEVGVISAGTLGIENQPATPNATTVTKERCGDIESHRSKGVSKHLIKDADIIFCMAQEHKSYILHHFPAYRENVFLLRDFATEAGQKMDDPDIFDPIGSSLNVYRECCKIIESELDRILPYLVDLIENSQQN